MPDHDTDSTWTGPLSFPMPGRDERKPPSEGGREKDALPAFPERLGPYVVETMVGRGGMAAVYRCRDASGEPVAVKWLHRPSVSLGQRFAREIRSLSKLNHPGVVRYVGHGEQDGRPFLVMEYLDGEDLRLFSIRLRNLPSLERYQRVRHIALSLAEALDHVHSHGLVHRDLKPSNIRVLEGDTCVLTDFGIVKDLADDGYTAAGVVVGTLHYASPEQLRGDPVDARTDLYGLGCTLYLLLLQRRPFENEDQAGLIRAHMEVQPQAPSAIEPTVPADLEAVILRLMAKRPQDRFPSAAAVIEALSRTEVASGVALAGRKVALEQVAQALDRVASGRGTLVQVTGAPGTGRRWVCRTLEEGATRRRLDLSVASTESSRDAALARLARGEPLLVVLEGLGSPVQQPDLVVHLEPLGPGDVRRSVVANARGVRDPAGVAERLFRATGGLPALLVPFLRRLQASPSALDGALPPISVDPWLEGLDLDAMEILQALAALRGPASPAMLESVTQVPAGEPLSELVRRGLVREIVEQGDGGAWGMVRYVVTAGLFAEEALSRVADPEDLERRLRTHLAQQRTGPLHLDTTAWMEWENRLKQAVALGWSDQFQQARSVLGDLDREASRSEDPDRRARGRLALGTVLWLAASPEEALQAFQDARTSLPYEPGVEAAALHGQGLVRWSTGHPDAAVEAFQAAAVAWRRSGQPAEEATSWLALSLALAIAGRLAGAVEAGERAVTLAQALRDPHLECATLQHLGLLLLDMRVLDEASRILGDVTALAHGSGIAQDRWTAHLGRAQVTLDAPTGGRSGAAAAMDRLTRVLGEKALPGTDAWRAFGHGLLARAAALVGDGRTFQRALDLATRGGPRAPAGPPSLCLPVPSRPMVARTRLQVARACYVACKAGEAEVHLEVALRDARAAGSAIEAWQAAWLRARIHGAPLPGLGPLGNGLRPDQRTRMEGGPAFP